MARYEEYISAALLLASLALTALASDPAQVPLPYATAAYEHELAKIHEQPTQSLPGGYVHEYGHGHDGYQLQSGIEGYLIPGLTEDFIKPSLITGLIHKAKPLVWKVLAILPKVGLVLAGVVGLVAIGTLLTSCICALTPICHIKFLGVKLSPESFRGFVTQDRMSEISSFIQGAIKKYQEMNAKRSIHPEGAESNQVK